MSYYFDYVPCEQCQELAYYELNTRSLEETVQCFACGYSFRLQALIDRQAQALDPEGREFYKRTKNGKLIYRTYKREGYGAYCIAPKKGSDYLGGLNKPLTNSEINEFIGVYFSSPDINLERCYLTKWDEKIKKMDVIYGDYKPLREGSLEEKISDDELDDLLTIKE